jgi:hypothetical protein
MNRPECESERLIYSLETSPKLQLLFENSAVGETYLFHRIASDCLRIPRFSIKASEPLSVPYRPPPIRLHSDGAVRFRPAARKAGPRRLVRTDRRSGIV